MIIKSGDVATIDYVGKLDNQVIFDSTENRGPMSFRVGDGGLIPAFEESVIGMKVGESKTVKVPFEEAYGPYSEENMFEVKKEEMPPELKLEIGLPLQLMQEGGHVTIVKIHEIKEDSVMIDANHPLAGENLTFEISVKGINDSEPNIGHSCGCGEDGCGDDGECCGDHDCDDVECKH